MSVCAVVGGQFGSEGKGLIVGEIARDYGVHVRVGAANAGHTVYTKHAETSPVKYPPEYEKHVMQQIPCAAYANPEAELFIGPGAQLSPEIFMRELVQLQAYRAERGLPPVRLYVDDRAHVITQDQIEREGRSGLGERIGSTSTIAREGIGVAQADRVMRATDAIRADSKLGQRLIAQAIYEAKREAGFTDHVRFALEDVPEMLARRVDRGILLEGTQGTGLSLTTGPWPYTTSRNTTAAGLCADAGVAPTKLDRVILVCRTFPIRVAGNSGPFFMGSDEISWDEIGIDPENERTTVTKLVRRVATFSMEQVQEAAMLNGATEIALTFADYLDPRIAQSTDRRDTDGGTGVESTVVREFIDDIESGVGLPVTFVGTGPHSVIRREAALADQVARAA